MVSMIRVLGALVLFVFSDISHVNAAGYVAETLRFKLEGGYQEVKAGQFWSKPLSGNPGAEIEVSVNVHNKTYDDVDVFLCSEREYSYYQAGREARCAGMSRGKRAFSFKAPIRTSERHYLIINNSFSMLVTKKVSYTVYVRERIEPEKRRALEASLSKATDEISKMFEVSEFDMRVEPCGSENAYSNTRTGDITMCSELFVDLVRSGKKGALAAILNHELGHTLLNLWGLPGYDNEETVDEFALVMLYLAGNQEHTIEWMEWFEKNDPQAEARQRIYNDVRHPLSVQRIRNIRRMLRDPRSVIERWNRLLYPKMTVAGLQDVLNTSPKHADTELARRLIDEKGGRGARHSDARERRPFLAPPPQRPKWSKPPPE